MKDELLKECYDLILWLSQWYFTPEPRKRIDDVLAKLRATQYDGVYCSCTLDELSDWTTRTPDCTCVRCRKPRS